MLAMVATKVGCPGTKLHVLSGNESSGRSTRSGWSGIVTRLSKMAEDSSVCHGRRSIYRKYFIEPESSGSSQRKAKCRLRCKFCG